MHWLSAGLILYSFAAPSSIAGVAYTFAHGGWALGTLCCVVTTGATIGGALLLLEVLLAWNGPRPRMLSDVGALVLGPVGGKCCLALQMLNFLLYLPVAMLTSAQALQDAVQPDDTTCTSYFVFLVAAVCFATTQCRELRHASLLAATALVAALGVALLQIIVVFSAPTPSPKPPAPQWVGPPPGSGESGNIELALSLTTCVWSYVPSLLVVELAHEMDSVVMLRRSIWLSVGIPNSGLCPPSGRFAATFRSRPYAHSHACLAASG